MSLRRQFGPWAVVTGASTGIGAEVCRQLAQAEISLVLVSRSRERLQTLAVELAPLGVEVRVHACDLCQPESITDLASITADLDVGLLVSNAGSGTVGAFIETEPEELSRVFELNARAHLLLLRQFAPRLVERGQGGLLVVSSTGALGGMPFHANYSGAKAYAAYLAESLHYELRGHGVHVTALLPGATDTPLLRDGSGMMMERLPMKAMSPEAVAREGLRALEKNRVWHVAGWQNRVLAFLLPRRLVAPLWRVALRWMVPRLQRRR